MRLEVDVNLISWFKPAILFSTISIGITIFGLIIGKYHNLIQRIDRLYLSSPYKQPNLLQKKIKLSKIQLKIYNKKIYKNKLISSF